MSTSDLQPGSQLPPLEGTGDLKKIRRALLAAALVTLLGSCGICWASARAEAAEAVLVPGLAGLAAILYSALILYQREQNQDLAPPLWRVGLVFLGLVFGILSSLAWLGASAGWGGPSPWILAVLGAWALFLGGRRVVESWSFSRRSVLEPSTQVELNMLSIEGGHPIHPELVFRYGEVYRGRYQNPRLRRELDLIQPAVREGRLQVHIRYLPDNPRVHRLESWEILEI